MQNGKGDDDRVSNWQKYWQNFDEIPNMGRKTQKQPVAEESPCKPSTPKLESNHDTAKNS